MGDAGSRIASFANERVPRSGSASVRDDGDIFSLKQSSVIPGEAKPRPGTPLFVISAAGSRL
jgi:hypothetical protein